MSKLSDNLKQLSSDISKLAAADRAKIYDAIRKSFGPVKSTRTTATGEKVDTRDVDFTAIAPAMPPDLRQDWRQIERDLIDASKRHGNQWADESFAYILKKYLLPQPTAAELLATPELVAAVAKQLPSMQPPSIDLDKLAEMVAAKLQEKQPSA